MNLMSEIGKLVLFLMMLSIVVKSQSITIGEKQRLYSTVLGEDREILVYLPDSYDKSDNKYPVHYILDGGSHFHHYSGILNLLAEYDIMPEVLLIAIPNTERVYNLTPKTEVDEEIKRYTKYGGADLFREFLKKELIPQINEKYRTNDNSTIIGHSLAGLFVLDTFIESPDLFDNYIAISPSSWWNGANQVEQFKNLKSDFLTKNKNILIALDSQWNTIWNPTKEIEKHLTLNNIIKLNWKVLYYPEDTHGTVVHKGMHDSVEDLYSDYQIKYWRELIKKGLFDLIEKHYENVSRKYGYNVLIPEDLFIRMSNKYLQDGNIEGAIMILEKYIKMHPASSNGFNSLGKTFEQNNNFEKAVYYYKKAVEIAETYNHSEIDNYKRQLINIQKK